jgi:polysaccharide export outer membrane protein
MRISMTLLITVVMSVTGAYAQDALPQQPAGPITDSSQPKVFEQPSPRYRIQQGDVIELTFPFTSEFNQTVSVHPDGFITLRDLGDVNVAGKTAPEVRTMLEQQYSVILKDPMITVKLTEFQKPAFIVSGEVGRPGKYEMNDGLTLSEAVAIAGGLTVDAKHSQVLLFRRASTDWVEVKEVNLKQMLKGSLSEDFDIRPGDMLYVPRTKMAGIKPWVPAAALPIAALRLAFGHF